MPRQTSWVWNYCTRSEDRKSASCNICNASFEYSGSTSSFNKHLKGIHCIMNNENSQENLNEQRDNNENMNESNQEGSIPGTSGVPFKSFSNIDSIRQTSRKRKREINEICNKDRQESISQALASLIATNQLPLSFAESDGFREFMFVVEPKYNVPAAKTILSRLHLNYDEIKKFLQHEIQRQGLNISCSTDIWTSLSQDSFLSLTAHYIDEETWEMKNHTLCTIGLEERHTAENIAIALEMIFSEWNLENHIFAIVHDNASNMINAAENLENVSTHINCAAHTLQLAVNEALQLEEIACVIQKARKIVGHFKHSTLATQELRNIQIQFNLPEETLRGLSTLLGQKNRFFRNNIF